jgi:DNA-binding transcriptional MerR regulator
MSDSRSHLSIGEVLSLLQDEFPDITISKIRFLESQGLLDPERTPSGYRKFYEPDIDRLRWILRQQKENFLPLKVIKDRLASGELDDPTQQAPLFDADLEPSAAATGADSATAQEPPAAADGARSTVGSTPSADTPATRSGPGEGKSPGPPAKAAGGGRKKARTSRTRSNSLLDPGETSVSMSVDELVAATGLTARAVGDLERFGLITSRELGSTSYYDEDALVVARLAAGFLRHGVEPRHLRMYKVAAEREGGVLEQLVMPLLKQRNPAARSQALDVLHELASLGDQFRGAMLRQVLREYLGES